jgi:phosphoribosylamine--glycine ligase
VLCATALGGTVAEAQNLAYNLVKRVRWDGAYYRTDIGYRAIARERGE